MNRYISIQVQSMSANERLSEANQVVFFYRNIIVYRNIIFDP